MGGIVLRAVVIAVILVAVTEVAKKSPDLGAIIASLPIPSVIALICLYRDTRDLDKVMELSNGILYMIVPSVIFYICFAVMIKRGFNFLAAVSFSGIATVVFFSLYFRTLKHMGYL